MKRLNKKFGQVITILVIGFIAAQGVSAQECTPRHQFKTVNKGYLTIALTILPPASMITDDKKITGIDNDVLKQFAKVECLEIKPISVAFSAAIQYIRSGRADISVGSWSMSKKRAKVLGLSAPLYQGKTAIVSSEGINTISGLKGKMIGSVQGYLYVPDLIDVFGRENIKLYPSGLNLINDLKAGRIDAMVQGYTLVVAARNAGILPDKFKTKIAEPDKRVTATVQPEYKTLPYTKGNKAFGEALDEVIESMHENGEIKRILKSYNLKPSLANMPEYDN